jgi:hypothetical protein
MACSASGRLMMLTWSLVAAAISALPDCSILTGTDRLSVCAAKARRTCHPIRT